MEKLNVFGIMNASREPLVDLIWSVMADVAKCTHLAEILTASKYLDGDEEKKNKIREVLDNTSKKRRAKMLYIQNFSDNLDPHMWCIVKHSMESYMTSYEFYLANDLSDDFLPILHQDEEEMFWSISEWLGFDFSTCGRCFSDELKASKYAKIESDKLKKEEIKNDKD